MRPPEMEYACVQVAMTIMNDRATEDREHRPPGQICDNWPKFAVTRNGPIQHRSGIVHENVTEPMGREGRSGWCDRAFQREQAIRKLLSCSYPLRPRRRTGKNVRILHA